MKLQTQLFLITDSKGKEINVEKKNIILALNGERTTGLKDIFSGLEFDAGEIYGNSLLSYYNVNEDGSLEVEGSKVQLLDAETDEPILVKRIKRPGVHDDSTISFEDIQKFSDYFKIAKPDEVFSNLSALEKQIFIEARISREEIIKNEAAATLAKETADLANQQKADAETERIAKEKAEAELKASIDPAYVQDEKAYQATKAFYATLDGFKQYTQDKYHLFYGDDPNESLCLLIERGATWKEEVSPENIEIISKNLFWNSSSS